MKKLLFRIFQIISPLGIGYIFATGFYIYSDPFKILHTYSNFNGSCLTLNRDYVSTEMFLNGYMKYHWNSFVFGSSRVMAFRKESLRSHLAPNAKIFYFDASAENVFGILQKLKLIENKNVKIDNALIILCEDASFTQQEGHLYFKHPGFSTFSWLWFQLKFFAVYSNPRLMISLIDFHFNHQKRDYMIGYLDFKKTNIDSITNEFIQVGLDSFITADPEKYYTLKRSLNVFYERTKSTQNKMDIIDQSHLECLIEIRKILEKKGTNYKVVFSPLYKQNRLTNNDNLLLNKIFGESFYDFSGKNYFTNSKYNYYENSHYRPLVGDSILKLIYSKDRSVSRSFK